LTGYSQINESITVDNSDLIENVILTEIPKTVTFNVSDESGNPLQNANIDINGGNLITDGSGVATIDLYNGTYEYFISLDSYNEINGSITVENVDLNENVTMVLTRYDVTFTVTDGANAIEGATVSLAGFSDQTTDVNGQTTFTQLLPANNIAYYVNASGYEQASGTVSIIDSDVNKDVTLDPTTYQVTFVVDDGTNALDGAEVSLSGYGTETTNAFGEAIFADVVPEADIAYIVSAAGYITENGELSVSNADETINISLTENTTTFTVEFLVSDTSGAIANATVLLDGYGSQTTNAFGEASFIEVAPESNISYIITATNHNEVSGTIDVVDQDVTEQVTMDLTSYAVTFNITDGTAAIDGAEVNLAGYGMQTTDAEGQTVFTEVIPEADIAYIVNSTGFDEYSGTVSVINENVSVDVVMTAVGLAGQGNIEFAVYPNPTSGVLNLHVTGENQVKIMDMSGAVVYSKKVATKETIDISNFTSGVYIMQIRQSERIATQRIILK